MRFIHCLAALAMIVRLAPCAAETTAVMQNQAAAKWSHDAGDPPGSESVTLREDARTGAVELFVRYPGGHTFKSHWHSVNERVLLIEGRLSIQAGEISAILEPGGYAFLPAREVQNMKCISQTRCGFYIHWDGKLDFNRPPVR